MKDVSINRLDAIVLKFSSMLHLKNATYFADLDETH